MAGNNCFCNYNLKQKHASQLKIKDPFLKEIVEYWSNLNYMRRTQILSQHVFGITHSLQSRRNLFFTNHAWFKAGVENVKDLLDEASRFISFDRCFGKEI